jgi:hypothetical protein
MNNMSSLWSCCCDASDQKGSHRAEGAAASVGSAGSPPTSDA